MGKGKKYCTDIGKAIQCKSNVMRKWEKFRVTCVEKCDKCPAALARFCKKSPPNKHHGKCPPPKVSYKHRLVSGVLPNTGDGDATAAQMDYEAVRRAEEEGERAKEVFKEAVEKAERHRMEAERDKAQEVAKRMMSEAAAKKATKAATEKKLQREKAQKQQE